MTWGEAEGLFGQGGILVIGGQEDCFYAKTEAGPRREIWAGTE